MEADAGWTGAGWSSGRCRAVGQQAKRRRGETAGRRAGGARTPPHRRPHGIMNTPQVRLVYLPVGDDKAHAFLFGVQRSFSPHFSPIEHSAE